MADAVGAPAPGWWQSEDGGWHPPGGSPDGPDHGKPANNNRQALIWGAVILAVCTVLVVSCLGSVDSGKPASDEPAVTPSAEGAINVCEQAVENQLKAPATAQFSGEKVSDDTDPGELPSFGTEFKVTGEVDSQNSFGAMIRISWKCTATATGGVNYDASATIL